jgi:two-component system chemotaxis response regulator CheY
MQILIVDDSRTMRMLVKRTLRQAGYGGHDVLEAADGAEALDLIRDQGVDLVLCDVNMPRMSGLELLQTLRARDNKVLFGFVTSEGTPSMREVAAQEGANFVITKPFTADVFASVLGGITLGNAAVGRQGSPDVRHLHAVLDDLMGRPVTVHETPTAVDPADAAMVWHYVFQDGTLAAAGAMDFYLAAVLATSLGLLPVGRVLQAIAAESLESDLVENLHEVANILVALYTPMTDEHIRLGGVWWPGSVGTVPASVGELLACRTRRLDAVVSVAGYGEGRLSMLPSWRLARNEATV